MYIYMYIYMCRDVCIQIIYIYIYIYYIRYTYFTLMVSEDLMYVKGPQKGAGLAAHDPGRPHGERGKHAGRAAHA